MIIQDKMTGHFYNPMDHSYVCECKVCSPKMSDQFDHELIKRFIRPDASLDAFPEKVGGAPTPAEPPGNRPPPGGGAPEPVNS